MDLDEILRVDRCRDMDELINFLADPDHSRGGGQMTHKVKIFENVFPDSAKGHRTMFRDQIW